MLKFSAREMQRSVRHSAVPNESRIADVMRQVFHLDEQEWPADRLLAHTQRGLDRAISWNLLVEKDIIHFLVLRHQFGERFDEFPAVRQFLSRKDLPTDNRIRLMMAELPLAIWDVVRRRTPPGPSAPTNVMRR